MAKQHDASNTQGRAPEPLISVGKRLFATSSIWLSAVVRARLIATISKIKWLIVFLYNSTHMPQSFTLEAVDHKHLLRLPMGPFLGQPLDKMYVRRELCSRQCSLPG